MRITVNGVPAEVSHLPEDPLDIINIRSLLSDYDYIIQFKSEIAEYAENFIYSCVFEAFDKPLTEKEQFIVVPDAYALFEILNIETDDNGMYCVELLVNGSYVKATEVNHTGQFLLYYNTKCKEYIAPHKKALQGVLLTVVEEEMLKRKS